MTNSNDDKYLSDCHQSPTKLSGGVGDFADDDTPITRSFICTKCEKPCNLYVPPKEETQQPLATDSAPNDDIDQAAEKAIKATNYCTKHKLYHGQQDKSCTPQERVMIKVSSGGDDIDRIKQALGDCHWHSPEEGPKAVGAIQRLLLEARKDELQQIFNHYMYEGDVPVIVKDRLADLESQLKEER